MSNKTTPPTSPSVPAGGGRAVEHFIAVPDLPQRGNESGKGNKSITQQVDINTPLDP